MLLCFCDFPAAVANDTGDASLLPTEILSATAPITVAGRSLAKIRVDDQDSLVAMPSSNAGPGTTMTFSTNERRAGLDIESFEVKFNRDVTFSGYPSFLLSVPQSLVDMTPGHKFLLVFEDGSASVAFREGTYRFGSLMFIGGFFTPFHARANQAYRAHLVAASESATLNARDSIREPSTLCTQNDNDVTSCIDFTVNATNSSQIRFLASSKPPEGVSNFRASNVTYLSLESSGRIDLGQAVLSFIVPLSREFNPLPYNIAWRTGSDPNLWHADQAPTSDRQGDLIRLKLSIPRDERNRFSGKMLSLALYSEPAQPDTPPEMTPTVAVLGDSISVLTVVPQNPLGCIASNEAPNHCRYSSDPTLSYPGVVAQLTGAHILNLALLNGSQTTVDRPAGSGLVKSWLHSSVLDIPPESNFVILEPGIADLGLNNGDPQTSSRLPLLVEAVRDRAPKAKIIFVGLRCCSAGNEAWNRAEQILAAKYGVYIDRHDSEPEGASMNTPDGLHCSPEYARHLGESIVSAMRALGF